MMLCSEVAMTDAEKESEARCKAMLNELISVVKKQTMEMEDLAGRMNELAVDLKAIVQPRGVPDHALPPSVTAPTPTLDHAVAAATPRADAALAPGSPTKCSMNCSGDETTSQTSTFRPDAALGSSSTTTLLDVAITSPEPTDATILVRDGTGELTPTPSSTTVHPIDLGDEHVPNLSNCQLGARKVFDRMCGTDGFSTNGLVLTTCCPNESSTTGIVVVDRATRRRERAHRVLILARLENSCGAMEFRPPWPPPTQVDVACSGVVLCPISWLLCEDYRGGVKWMPPWSPPVLGRMLILEKGFCPAINSTEVMCSFLPFDHMRMVSEGYESECSEDFDSFRQSWSLDEKILIQSLYKIIAAVSEFNPVILYIRDVNQFLASSERAYSMFQKMLKKLYGRVLIIGSYFLESDEDSDDVDEGVNALFPYILETKPPKEETHLEKWKTQMEDDMKKIQTQEVRNHIAEVLSANSLECDDLNSIDADDDFNVIANYIEEIMAPAVSYHLMNDKDPEYRNGKLIISSESLSQGLIIFQESNLGKDTVEAKDEAKRDIPDNEYEKRIRPSVIPANEIGVTFDDIGALADIKESLQELVMLPLQRPDLFKGGGLLKQCRGILLFGPPGTGKTMLAKAIANEAGASFLNISMSSITSKWYGEAEKSIRALFSLAAKIEPAIVFVDEVDSMLGRRDHPNENEVSRKIKNEFMTHWDGLLSKSNERILVLAATNRPFDLDEAIIRRFEHRIMVGLPTSESRELIFRTLFSKEKVENIDFKELAKMTEGYSGSDLKNLCVAAAYRPVRELVQKEQQRKKDKKENAVKVKEGPEENPKQQESGKENLESNKGEKHKSETKKGEKDKSETKKGKKEKSEKDAKGEAGETIALRPLTMDDVRQAKDDVAASFASEGAVMNQIKQWNDLYGKGGSRKKEQLTYFL